MKSIVSSQLTGKWYLIAQTENSKLMTFVDVFIYLSISCEKYLDLLLVGIKEDRTKILRKMSLKIYESNNETFVVLQNLLFRNKLRILKFDKNNGLIILADKTMKYVSVFSRKSSVSHQLVERTLNEIEFFKQHGEEIELFSNKIF